MGTHQIVTTGYFRRMELEGEEEKDITHVHGNKILNVMEGCK